MLNQKILGDIGVIIPSIEIQEKFTQIVHNIETMKKKQINSDVELNHLFNSLMEKAFNGELKESRKSYSLLKYKKHYI
ncbi:restriction endonuclease subunit S domain-containing protein [Terrisporobacter hibernicus]|uniref:Type I restriction modification DNA specificity domain-containing protein n=1 Tax=Terrisporobacter hibernicus TaxID=2813371 RepID=A0AAX2ZI84_9FIRM|nr:hypothetical protein [Terrisporobacter hibernicus]UEL48200.1 hypothetical protein JW646_01745 [Terrisporobacter hibernicus]